MNKEERDEDTKVAEEEVVDVEPVFVTREGLKEMLGEGFHTAFRKAIDSPAGSKIWNMIQHLPPEDWSGVLEFVLACLVPYLTEQGVEVRSEQK